MWQKYDLMTASLKNSYFVKQSIVRLFLPGQELDKFILSSIKESLCIATFKRKQFKVHKNRRSE